MCSPKAISAFLVQCKRILFGGSHFVELRYDFFRFSAECPWDCHASALEFRQKLDDQCSLAGVLWKCHGSNTMGTTLGRKCQEHFSEETNLNARDNARGFHQNPFNKCMQCEKEKPQDKFLATRWDRDLKKRLCLECSGDRRCSSSPLRGGCGKFSKDEWKKPDGLRKCKACTSP